MKKFTFFAGILLAIFACKPTQHATEKGLEKEKTYKILTVAFYNQENLFDTKNDPKKFDERSPIMEMPPAKRPEVYKKKLHNMASVISEIGKKASNSSPAILGICEIENRKVVEDLINQPELIENNYGIIHYPGPDERSIDVALLYQKDLFRPISSKAFEVVMYDDDDPDDRDYTRDNLLVTGFLDGDKMHFIVNHWPSRSGGEVASQYKRLAAAEVNKKIIDSIQNIDPYAKIITMGDFNDNPYNKSIKEILGAKAEEENVKMKGFFNPYEVLHEKGYGTGAYRDGWDLFDQIILSKPFLKNEYNSYRFYKAFIYNPNYLLTPSGEYRGYPYRSFSGGGFSGGYSNHFPVYVYLIKEKEAVKKR